jgi:hypothetical protein
VLTALVVFQGARIKLPSDWQKMGRKKKQNWLRKHERRLEKEAKQNQHEPGARCSLVHGAMTLFVSSDEADWRSPCSSVISGLILISVCLF